MPDDFPPGAVWLVGAGPGDPELLTGKAQRLMASADVIFHDALVGPAILDLAPSSVRLVSVGKRSGRHSRSQDEINQALVRAAQSGLRVVRLKGGDPSIFGRSPEEIEHLSARGIPVQICPGVTAASAAVASAGVALTRRGAARRVQFVTAHARAGEPLSLDWAALADPDCTLAIYMGKAVAQELSRQLLAQGRSPATPCLMVENASLPAERRVWTTLGALPTMARAALGAGPALILVGEAVARPATCSAGRPGYASSPQRKGDEHDHIRRRAFSSRL